MNNQQKIVISREAFGFGFDVEIVPPPLGVGHGREFRTHKEAFGYASGLRLAHGLPIHDLSGEVAK